MIHLVFAVLVLFVIYLVQSTQKPKHYPPGPAWVPFTGSSKEFKRVVKQMGGIHLAAEELSKVYNSDIIGVKLGRENVVIITKYKLVKEILTRDDFNGRPDNFFMRLRCMGTRRGITGIEGPVWHRHRSFLIKHFKTLGFGNKTMEFMIHEELCEIMDVINCTKRLRIEKLFAPAVLNVLWSITFGSRKDRTDKHMNQLLNLFERRAKAFDISGGVLSQYPWLRFLAPERTGYNLVVKLNEEVKAFFMKIITEHYKNWADARSDDFIYSFITEMKKEKDETFNEDQLIMICLDIFFGGASTTSNTIDFTFLVMILYPDIQKKVQSYIDEVIEADKSICYSDRLRLPYVEAVLLEILRMYAVVPMAGPRTVSFDTVLDEFIIPKNTSILYSIYSVHMDREYWGDPDVFRPERFLNTNGKIIHEDRILAFGHGKRRCLGEILARSCLFIFFTEIIRKYSISLAANSPQPKGIPVPGMILLTEEYTAEFTERKAVSSS